MTKQPLHKTIADWSVEMERLAVQIEDIRERIQVEMQRGHTTPGQNGLLTELEDLQDQLNQHSAFMSQTAEKNRHGSVT